MFCSIFVRKDANLFSSYRSSERLIVVSCIYHSTVPRHGIRWFLDVSKNSVWVPFEQTYLGPCGFNIGWGQCCTPSLIVEQSKMLLTDVFNPFAAHVFYEITIRRLAAASLRHNLPCSWCHRVDIGTAVSLDRSAYVLEFGELFVPTRTASAGSIALVMVVVCEGEENPKTVVARSTPFYAVLI